jgi:hypothetical protein
LSDLGISASGYSDILLSLSKKLPAISLSARGGAIGGELRLPVPELTISVIGDLVGRLTKFLPPITIDAQGSSDFIGSLARRLPAFDLTISMSVITKGTLSKKIPTLKLTAEASLNQYGTLSKDLPGIIVSDMTGHRSSIDIDVDLPTIIMAAVGTGNQDGMGAEMQNTSRFTDYVLRYSR